MPLPRNMFSRNTIKLAIAAMEDAGATDTGKRLAGLVLAIYAREQLAATEPPTEDALDGIATANPFG